MGTQGGTGRKRGSNKEKSTAEDDALNLIAREAEARLAAKRAARAEAREIRMKELERQQKEISDDDERMSVGSRSSVRVEGDFLEKGSRAASVLTAGTLTSLGGTSSRRGSVDTAIDADAETSMREIKDALVEVDEKYRKAMVSNAQLDNEKNNLMYQVDTLKDSLMELEELLSESRREYDEKVKEHEREKQAHSTLQFQYNQLQDTLKQSEEMLNKHGIVLGPDMSINGGVEETDGQTQEAQMSPTEGNSVLGRGWEPQLGSSGAEKSDSQHQETFEEPKESLLSSTAPSSLSIVSGDKASNVEQEISSIRDSVEEVTFVKKDCDEDTPITDEQNAADTVPDVGEVIVSTEEKVTEVEVNGVERIEKGDLVDTSEPETEAKTVHVDDSEPVINEMMNGVREMTNNDLSEDQATTLEEVETVAMNMRSIDSSAQPGEFTEDTMNKNIPDNSAPITLITEPHIESESAEEEAENEEPKELPVNAQNTAVAGKKKKRKKKKGKKKKGGPQEEEKQSEKEKGLPEKISLTHKVNATENSPFETPNELVMDQLTNEQDRKEVDTGMSVVGPDTESSVSTTNLTSNLKGSISAGSHHAKSVSGIENSKDAAESPWETDTLNAEPEMSDRSKDESVSVNEVNSELPTDNQVNRTDTTESTANIEAELDHLSNTEVSVLSEAVSNSESEKNNLHLPSNTDFDESLPGSKVPLESGQTTIMMSGTKDQSGIQSSVEDVLDIMEMDEPTLSMETKSLACNDGDHSMLSQEEMGKDPELNVGLMEPENGPKCDCTDSPTENPVDESSGKSCNVSVDEQCGSDATIMSKHVDHVSGPTESQGLSMPVFVGEKEAKETDLETEQGDTTNISQKSELTKEAAKTGSFTEHEHGDEAPAIDEDGQSLNGCEESDDNKQTAHQQDPVEESDEEGDECLSFDFDDLDAAENVPSINQVAEPETDLEVTPVEVNHADTDLAQGGVIWSQEEAQPQVASLEEPVESDQEMPTIHGTLDEDLDSVSLDHQSSSDIETVLTEKGENENEDEQHTTERKTSGTDEQAHGSDEPARGLDEPVHGLDELVQGSEDPGSGSDEPVHGLDELVQGSEDPGSGSDEPARGSDEPVHGSERGSGNAGELGVVESNSVEEVVIVEKEEGIKAIEQDLELLQNTADQASSKKETPPSRKDSKKNGKKGKSKGKEDCKMS